MFFKVTCPTCQLAAPVAERLHRMFPRRLVAVGQDSQKELARFSEEFGITFDMVVDEPPYPLSKGYEVRTVPTLFVLDEGKVVDMVESWDRHGWNRAAGTLGELVGSPAEPVSWEGDGLPPFRPG